MWVKICANTSLEDALMAADLGADAVGFVFAPSQRQVTVAQVALITPHVPAGVERVGVFLGSAPEDLDRIAAAAELSGLTAVQLHGAAPLSFVDGLQQRLGPGYSMIQTAHWRLDHDKASETRVSAQFRELSSRPDPYRMLVDAKVGSASGGLGVPFDWVHARSVLMSQPSLNVIVAGGLNPENVCWAITQLKPYGVDVATGVEEYPGKKDPAKVRQFIQAARGAV